MTLKKKDVTDRKQVHYFIYGSEPECKETIEKLYAKCDSKLIKKIGAFDYIKTKRDLLFLIEQKVKINIYYCGHGYYNRSDLNPHYFPVIQCYYEGKKNWYYTEFLNEFTLYENVSILCECCCGSTPNASTAGKQPMFADWELGDSSTNYICFSSSPPTVSNYYLNELTPFHRSYNKHPATEEEIRLLLKNFRETGCGSPRAFVWKYNSKLKKWYWHNLPEGYTTTSESKDKVEEEISLITMFFSLFNPFETKSS